MPHPQGHSHTHSHCESSRDLLASRLVHANPGLTHSVAGSCLCGQWTPPKPGSICVLVSSGKGI